MNLNIPPTLTKSRDMRIQQVGCNNSFEIINNNHNNNIEVGTAYYFMSVL